MSDHILIEKSGGVLTLTMNRPDKKNALTRAMYQTLGDAIDQAAFDKDVRCVVIQGNGDMFTAGNDLADFAAVNAGESSASEARRGGNPLLAALARAKTPLIAAVNGRAVGVGTTMLLHCDLVYVAENALLTTPFVNLALVPEAASSITLPSRIGHTRAFSMFVLGEAVDAKKAVEWGIANEVVPLDQLRAKARAAAEAVAARPPAAVTITKALMRDEVGIATRMDEEGVHFAAQLKSPEAKEAFAAFAEKRAPDFGKVA
ncbi:MAG: enoyl-CoA hydratase-related protein [Pseudomonadota bacterium]|mgnify:CR=1 FL=1|uniref:enoyl-CoA hydratase-related protein n=1 Tax=unclassified Phenylobacterium TaxID=2640670 RepID=UPI0006FFBBB5|nr:MULTISPECIES: enoyl-CoA hydratase-related protein [unclassified Phenylobacterium]KRB52090.1 enoyl-CoA hydratase [Phenylobacterium sp. Root700]MBT9471248.1 enoyl-CoA hydratase/isomerase family protein [Phenylobacterium sp.]